MAAPGGETTRGVGGPLRALPVVVICGAIVAIAVTRTVSVDQRSAPARRTNPAFDIRANPVYVCPMDPDVRSNGPGRCRRCGMALVAGIPDPVEFHLDLTTSPDPPAARQTTTLDFAVHDPWKDRPVHSFVVVHEKLFHAFVVSQDLNYFNHGHPVLQADGTFTFPVVLPTGGMFRVLGDFYPDGATPQLITETLFVPGDAPPAAALSRDYSTKSDRNLRVSLTILPEQATAGTRTQMTFHIDPADGFEKYLGAWGHMLAASDDLIDMIHLHPFRADGGDVQFKRRLSPPASLPRLGAVPEERRCEYGSLRCARRGGAEVMRQAVVAAALAFGVCAQLRAHDVSTTPITWNREISRIFYERCASCHRPGGTSFSLMSYQDVQPRAVTIRDAVLSRRMPPWGAVSGFGDFRNNQALTAEQIELITDWVQDDTPKGNNPRMLPPVPKFGPPESVVVPADAVPVSGTVSLKSPIMLDGLLPNGAADGARIVAERPDGSVEPLLWLYGYSEKYRHAFLLRKPVALPAGTIIRGVRPQASVLLLPAGSSGTY